LTGGPECALQGRRIVVTGASSGIGRATARILGRAGAHVAIHFNTHADAARRVLEEIEASGGRAVVIQADLTDPPSRDAFLHDAIEALGGLFALVNVAGGTVRREPVGELSRATWMDTLELNLTAPFFLAQQAFSHMRKNGGGRIVNVSSIGVKYGGSRDTVHYAAAKSALETASLGLARAGAEHDILVNVVRPGVIDTPIHDDIPSEAMRKRISKILLKRAGAPEDVAFMIRYLLSPAAGYVTGQTFAVSGGD
jgi:3-oxoacyl-[acyl-carrier protein] reductase